MDGITVWQQVGEIHRGRAGLVHVIEGHRVFTQLSVTDNLLLAGYDVPRSERATRVEEALSFFPEMSSIRPEQSVQAGCLCYLARAPDRTLQRQHRRPACILRLLSRRAGLQAMKISRMPGL